MDGRTGTCHTSFCGSGDVGCCRVGMVQPPCDGLMGCKDGQCCAALTKPPPPPPSPIPSPPPPIYGLEEQALVNEAHCGFAGLGYSLGKTASVGGFSNAQARISVNPWHEDLQVVLLLLPHGEYIEVRRWTLQSSQPHTAHVSDLAIKCH